MKHDNSILDRMSTLDISELVFPRLCFGCSEPLFRHEDQICLQCEQQLPITRSFNLGNKGLVSLFADRNDLNQAYSLMEYQKGGIVQSMLRRLKYDGAKEIGIGLGERFGAHLNENQISFNAAGFVAVPLHPAKVLRRGYNQSDMIIQGLREQIDLPDLSQLIERTAFTESQTSKGRYERFENMDHVFRCPDPTKVAGLSLIIVDDVVTTGSTMKACMNALAQAGAKDFNVLAIAVA